MFFCSTFAWKTMITGLLLIAGTPKRLVFLFIHLFIAISSSIGVTCKGLSFKWKFHRSFIALDRRNIGCIQYEIGYTRCSPFSFLFAFLPFLFCMFSGESGEITTNILYLLCYCLQIALKRGLEMLNIFKRYSAKTSILDDLDFYEDREKAMRVKRCKETASRKMEIRVSREFYVCYTIPLFPNYVSKPMGPTLC